MENNRLKSAKEVLAHFKYEIEKCKELDKKIQLLKERIKM